MLNDFVIDCNWMPMIAEVSWDYHKGVKGSWFQFWKSQSTTPPVFGSAEGKLCLCFYLTLAEDETDEEFVSEVEQFASKIIGEISEREYLSHCSIGDTMP